jgi:nucleoside-diphosphate-sugar epimerase
MIKTVRSVWNKNILIVGCGYVGQRLAAELAPQAKITGLVRTSHTARQLSLQRIDPMIRDLDRPLSTLSHDWQQIYYFAPPPKQGQQDARMAHFLRALDTNEQNMRLVYLGTTGVYGDCNGDWVDERQPLNPTVDRALRRQDAEQQLHQWRTATGNEVIFLRVAGIYGPDKLPLARLRQGKPMIAATHAPWTNRIHVDDLVQTCIAAMKRGRDGETYNVSDGQPGNMADYFNQVADAAGLPRPPVILPEQATGQLSAGLRSYLAESRRIDNRKMLKELRIHLKYPTLSQGLAAC